MLKAVSSLRFATAVHTLRALVGCFRGFIASPLVAQFSGFRRRQHNQNTPLVLTQKRMYNNMRKMRRDLKILSCVLVGVSLCPGTKALVPSQANEDYQSIPDRNLFGLHAPQLPTNEPPALQLPKILLTGITTILGDKRALMRALPSGGKPGDTGKEQSLILGEGQREGNIEVLAIDERAGSVKVNNSGTVMTLTFEKDGPKLSNTAPPPGVPSALHAPTNMASPAVVAPSYASPLPGAVDPKRRGLPMRNLRLPANSGASDAALPPTGAPAGSVPAQGAADLTPEEQTILLELQRQANQQNPNFPPLPQTAITTGSANVGPQTPTATPPTVPQQILPQ
jgi:hypothetical protein